LRVLLEGGGEREVSLEERTGGQCGGKMKMRKEGTHCSIANTLLKLSRGYNCGEHWAV